MLWNKFPLIKFVVLFSAGTIVQKFLSLPGLTLLLSFLLLLVLNGSLLWFKSKLHIMLASSSLLIIICGASYYHVVEEPAPQYPFEEKYIENILIKAEVLDIDLPDDGRLTLTLQTCNYYHGRKKFNLHEKILCRLYYQNESILKIINRLKPGNTIMITGALREPAGEMNPGEFNYQEYLLGKGITAQLSSYNPDDLIIIDGKTSPVWSAVYTIRLAVDRAVHKIYNKETAALLRGLLLADRSLINDSLRTNFVNAGVVHVLAVSGLHVGYIVLIFYFLFGRLNIFLRCSLTITGLLCFVLLTGAPPSVVRASIMASVILISLLAKRTHNNYNALAFAAFILLLLHPSDLFNPGFQLSFAAVLSIFIFLPLFEKFIKRFTKNKIFQYVLIFIAVSLAAQIGTLPFTLHYFEKLSVVSLLANLFVIPAVGFILAVGMFSLVVFTFSAWLASVFALVNMLIVKLLYWAVNALGGLKFAYIYIPRFSPWDGIVFYTFLAVQFLYTPKFTRKASEIVFILLTIGVTLVLFRLDDRPLLPAGRLSILNLSLGNSECILLHFPDGKTALISAGTRTARYDHAERTIIPLLQRNSISHLDYIFLTDVSARNNLGIISLIEHGYVGKVYKPRVYGRDLFNRYFENYLAETNVHYEYYNKEKINIGGTVVYPMPLEDNSGTSYYNIFNTSVPVKVVYGKTSILFPGRLETRGENVLISAYSNFLKSDVLKVANNGSNIGTSNNFLSYIKPEYSMIDVQLGNWLNYPSDEVIKRLTGSGSIVLSTETEGAILLISDGNMFKQIDWKNN